MDRLYIDLLPRDLVYELLDFFPMNELVSRIDTQDKKTYAYILHPIFKKYLTRDYWLRWLSNLTKQPKHIFRELAIDDHLYDYLNYLYKYSYRYNYAKPNELYIISIPYGYLSILKYIDEHYPNAITEKDRSRMRTSYELAKRYGHKETTDYLTKKYGNLEY